MVTAIFRDKRALFEIRNNLDHIQRFWLEGVFYEATSNGILPWLYENCKGWRFVDVGASIGNHTLFALCVLDSPRVISIEPYKESYEHLLVNLDLNTFSGKITVHNLACADREGTCSMKPFGVNNSGMVAMEQGSEIKMVTLDSLIDITDEPTIIKIDVEGATTKVLHGAKELLKSKKAIWTIEAGTTEELMLVDNLMENYKRYPMTFNPTPTYIYIPTNND